MDELKKKSTFYYVISFLPVKSGQVTGLSLIFEVGGDIQKIARDLSSCSEVNMLVLYQSSQGYTSKYEGKIPGPWSLMAALKNTSFI